MGNSDLKHICGSYSQAEHIETLFSFNHISSLPIVKQNYLDFGNTTPIHFLLIIGAYSSLT